MSQTPSPIAYSVNDAVAVSSIGRTRLYELIRDNHLQVTKVGRRTLVKADSLHRLIALGLPEA